jgi:hypothetical protein
VCVVDLIEMYAFELLVALDGDAGVVEGLFGLPQLLADG